MLNYDTILALLEQVEKLPPEVRYADADELIEAGWGDVDRRRIPVKWRDVRPGQKRIWRVPEPLAKPPLAHPMICCQCGHRGRSHLCHGCTHPVGDCCTRDRYVATKECCKCKEQSRASTCSCGHAKCFRCVVIYKTGKRRTHPLARRASA